MVLSHGSVIPVEYIIAIPLTFVAFLMALGIIVGRLVRGGSPGHERIEIIRACDAHRGASPKSEVVARIESGSELPLLGQDDRDYYKVAF